MPLRRVLLCAAAIAVVVGMRPDWSQLSGPAHLARWVAQAGPDAVLATLAGAALWCTGVWILAGLVFTCLATLPGSVGRAGARLSRWMLPTAVRVALAGTAGVGVVISPWALHGTTSVAASPASSLPAPSWPTNDPLPPPVWPLSGRAARAVGEVVVRPGDSLWCIAARALAPRASAARIAASWPRWYAANRAVIGPDPNLIRPGEHLTAPTGAHR